MKAADARTKIRAFARRWAQRIGRDFTHCRSNRDSVPTPSIVSPLLSTRGKYVRNIYPGWA